ncbi:MAG: hypothetical protein WC441_00990 [Patescibacteria group bacterium]
MTAGEQFSLIPEFEKADRDARSEAQAEAAQDREEEEKKIQETLNRGTWEAELKALDDEKRAEEIAAAEKKLHDLYEKDDPWSDINSPITNEILRSKKRKR